MTKKEKYVEKRLTTFDRVCQHIWLWPVASVFAIVIVGMFTGITLFTYITLNSFVFGFSLVVR
jgi:ABC-type proline/glycine betaine transport system permease subunit